MSDNVSVAPKTIATEGDLPKGNPSPIPSSSPKVRQMSIGPASGGSEDASHCVHGFQRRLRRYSTSM